MFYFTQESWTVELFDWIIALYTQTHLFTRKLIRLCLAQKCVGLEVVFLPRLNYCIHLLDLFTPVFCPCFLQLHQTSIYLYLSVTVYSHFYFFITRKMMEWSFDDRVWCYHSPCYQSLPPFAAWLLNHTPVHSTFICLNCHCPSWSLLDRPISSNEGN